MEKEIRNPFEEFGDAELAYKIASLGLIHPNEEKYSSFLLAAKEYKKAVIKLSKHLKEEIKSVDVLIDAVHETCTTDQMRHEEGEKHD